MKAKIENNFAPDVNLLILEHSNILPLYKN